MKYNKYLIITFPILIILVSAFFYTKNIIYFYLTIPICIYVSFVRYYQEKNKLLIKTNKILNLLKYEFTMYTVAVLTIYSTSSFGFISKIKSVEYTYIGCGIFVALLLLTGVINIKRTLLIRGLQNLGLTRGGMSFKLMIPFFKKIDIKKIIFLLKFNS